MLKINVKEPNFSSRTIVIIDFEIFFLQLVSGPIKTRLLQSTENAFFIKIIKGI